MVAWVCDGGECARSLRHRGVADRVQARNEVRFGERFDALAEHPLVEALPRHVDVQAVEARALLGEHRERRDVARDQRRLQRAAERREHGAGRQAERAALAPSRKT
jgi:hypothetical protein